MEESELQRIARQLRQPEGDMGRQMGEKMNTGNEWMNRWTIEQLQISPNDHVLEIGMGNGFFVKDIVSVHSSVRYAGCDYSTTMVEEAMMRNKPFVEEGRAEFFLATASQLPFGEKTFDTIFTVNTLYFWENPAYELAEIRRVLKPKGRFVLSIRPASTLAALPFTRYGFTAYTRAALISLLSENFFAAVTIVEREESAFDFAGQPIILETLIVCAEPVFDAASPV